MRYFVRFFLASLTASVYERSDARFVQQSLGETPPQGGYGSGGTCWRRLGRGRLRAWHWLHLALLAELGGAGQLCFQPRRVDGASVAGPGASSRAGTRRTRNKLGSKTPPYHRQCRVPLMFCVTRGRIDYDRWCSRS